MNLFPPLDELILADPLANPMVLCTEFLIEHVDELFEVPEAVMTRRISTAHRPSLPVASLTASDNSLCTFLF